jgi:hypothetical protein
MTGAITCNARVSESQSTRSAVASPSQKRRRERRMYQFERSSTYCSNDWTTPGDQKRS